MRTGETRADIRHPEKDGVGPPVDLRLKLGVQEYAIEHTRIEPFENQIKTGVVFKEINDCIKRRLSDTLPGSAYTSNDCIQGMPKGFNCAIELLRWPDAALLRRKPSHLGMKLICPDVLEDLRVDRLTRAFSDKRPKLKRCKAAGARTILVLESRDIALTSLDLIGDQLPVLLAERTDAPDEIYLVETHTNPWWVWLMKHDDDPWPTGGMPRWNQTIYEPDNLPTAGMPKWYRDALQLDQLYTAQMPGWTPTTFEEDELEDLTAGRGSKRL